MRYRKREEIIEAEKYWNNNAHLIILWLEFRGVKSLMWEHEIEGAICIFTPEGDLLAMPDDYVAIDARGKIYVHKSDMFEMTYEKIAPSDK